MTATRDRGIDHVPPEPACSSGLAAAAFRPASIAPAVAVLRTATTAMATRTDRLPNPAIRKLASGGPKTHAKETIARVLTTSDRPAPLPW